MSEEFINAVRGHVFEDGLSDLATRARYRIVSLLGDQFPESVKAALEQLENAYVNAYTELERHDLLP